MGVEARGAGTDPFAACSLSRDEVAFAVGIDMPAVTREMAASQI